MSGQKSSARIMLIHDDDILLVTLSNVLTEAGFAVSVFTGFQRALSNVRDDVPDLIIAKASPSCDRFRIDCMQVIADSKVSVEPGWLSLGEERAETRKSYKMPIEIGEVISIYPPFEPTFLMMAVQFSLHLKEIKIIQKAAVFSSLSLGHSISAKPQLVLSM